MIGALVEIAEVCDLTLPERYIRPIGIVGTGAIIDVGHLPAYRAVGIPVPAIWGRTRGHAERLANAHDIPRAHDSLGALPADPEIAVVDIAVVPQAQLEIALAALEAGKDVICQKPLALSVPATTSGRCAWPKPSIARARPVRRWPSSRRCRERLKDRHRPGAKWRNGSPYRHAGGVPRGEDRP